ncbi:AraC family transcriptional regulator [Klebsiella variicola]|uniref:AraC family transcriptional regulator n=1 Tax=Klebsiella variicola TaxID=244366 RepID=A0A7H4MHU8_KLEVA|nr:AraC family transcriptional regulator [Klebsiella variicola]
MGGGVCDERAAIWPAWWCAKRGLSFRRWRHQLQLILALQLLIRGQTVQQTAQALGYDSTTAFITMFKKGLGQTPGRYHGSLATTSQ